MLKYILLIFCCSLSVYSQSNFMNIHLKSGKTFSVPITEINKLTFGDTTYSVNENNRIIRTLSKNEDNSNVYPNPFSKTVTFEFEVQQAGNVDIQILTENGGKIYQQSVFYSDAGIKHLTWDCSDGGMASGNYYLRVKKDNLITIKKIIYLK